MHCNPVFEAFVPAKSKVLGKVPEASILACKGQVKNKATSRITALFATLKSDRNALAIIDSNQTDTKGSLINVATDRPPLKTAEKNLSTVSRFPVGSGPTHPKLIFKLDIEANFDLRPLLLCDDVSSTYGTCGLLRSSCLPDASNTSFIRQKLSKWADSQHTWVYPDRPLTAVSMKLNGTASAANGTELSPYDYWQEPSIHDISNICVIKRRRLKWQAALCSAVDELLLEPPSVDSDIKRRTLQDGFTTNRMESFYILGSDSEGTDSHATGKESDAKPLPMSAYFFRMKEEKENDNAEEKLENNSQNFRSSGDENVFCILSGAKKSLTDRLIELGACPEEMKDKQELLRSKAVEERNKKANRNISSVGRLQEISSGKTLFLCGSFALRIAADCLAEMVFATATAKSSRLVVDVPTIVSDCPFSNGIRATLHASLTQCTHNFTEVSDRAGLLPLSSSSSSSSSSALDDFDTETATRNPKSKVSRPFHRIFLTGVVYPNVLASLSELLCALSQSLPPKESNEVEGSRGVMDAGGVSPAQRSTDHHNLQADGKTKDTGDMKMKKNDSFSLSMLRSFDDALLHPRTVTKVAPDTKNGEDSAEDPGSVLAILSADSSKLPKIPMKFTSSASVDSVGNKEGGRGQGEPGPSSSRPLGSNVLTAGSYSTGQTSSEVKTHLDDGWVGLQRVQEMPYFFVRAASSARMEAFCHYLQPLPLPKGQGRGMRSGRGTGSGVQDSTGDDEESVMVAPEDSGADGIVRILDSYAPITRIRWSDSMTEHVWGGRTSDITSSGGGDEDCVRAVRNNYSANSGMGTTSCSTSSSSNSSSSSSSNSSSSSSSSGEVSYKSGLDTTGKKRKHPLTESTPRTSEQLVPDYFFEVINGAKAPVMCLVEAKHSKITMKEKMDFESSGAILSALNEYEIYAPETIGERERKRMAM